MRQALKPLLDTASYNKSISSVFMYKRIFAALLLCLTLSPALATLTFRITEEGGNVIIRATGTVNTAGLVAGGGVINCAGGNGAVSPGVATVCVGAASSERYSGVVGPASFGPGAGTIGSSASGQAIVLLRIVGSIGLPAGYVSGAPLAGTTTFLASTFASLGITPGTYTYTFGAGPTADAVIVVTGPAPVVVPAGAATIPTLSEWAMFMLASLMAGVAVLRMRRR